MGKLIFSTLNFKLISEGLEVTLLKIFKTIIPKDELETLGSLKVDEDKLEFLELSQDQAEKKFPIILSKYMEHLKNKMTGNSVTYIHQYSGIPLIGNVAFGIVYRNSSIIEIKPVTSCNLNCVYCSISEGLSSKKHDFVVEKDYMISEVKRIVKFVKEPVEIHVGVQGEPFLYADMENLIADLQKIKDVHTISIDTNGTMLSKKKIDDLAKYDKLQLNMSLDAIDEDIAKKIAGTKGYNISHVLEMIKYASKKIKIIVAPVLTRGYNEDQIEKIIEWVKTLDKKPILGIQNFLYYKTGRKAAKEFSWNEFYQKIENWEKKYDIKLKLTKEDFNIKKTRKLEKPFKKGDIVIATIKCQDRFQKSCIAVAKDRTISIPGCLPQKEKKIKVKILRDKHNVFSGKMI